MQCNTEVVDTNYKVATSLCIIFKDTSLYKATSLYIFLHCLTEITLLSIVLKNALNYLT